MNEPNYIPCHVFTKDGTVKDSRINADNIKFDYTKYLYEGELYFHEKEQDGKYQNIIITKDKYAGLVNDDEEEYETIHLTNSVNKGMKFFKFYTYITLPISLILNIGNCGSNILTGIENSNPYNISIGAMYIPLICAFIYGIDNLKKFTNTAYKINMYALIYLIALNTLFCIFTAVTGDYISAIINLIIIDGADALIILYFYKRKHLFGEIPKSR